MRVVTAVARRMVHRTFHPPPPVPLENLKLAPVAILHRFENSWLMIAGVKHVDDMPSFSRTLMRNA